jgi:hypothetical protein
MAYRREARAVEDRGGGGRRWAKQRAGVAPLLMPASARSRSYPELDCLRNRLPRSAIAAIERRATEIGVGAERVLIATGILTEENYLKLLARSLGLEFEPFDQLDRSSCPLDDRQLIESARTGLLPFLIDGELVFVVAPRSVRQFASYMKRSPCARFRVTSATRLDRFIACYGYQALGRGAAFDLDANWPQLSAASRSQRLRFALAATVALVAAAIIVLPEVVLQGFAASLSAYFLCWLALRNAGSLIEPPLPAPRIADDRDLPTYTVIAALYREAEAAEGLVAALRQLDYPGILAQTPQTTRLPLPTRAS